MSMNTEVTCWDASKITMKPYSKGNTHWVVIGIEMKKKEEVLEVTCYFETEEEYNEFLKEHAGYLAFAPADEIPF